MTTTESGPTTSEAAPTTTEAAVVEVATSITPDDNTRVEAGTGERESLAFTGSSSLWLMIAGGVALVAGLTLVLIARGRTRDERA